MIFLRINAAVCCFFILFSDACTGAEWCDHGKSFSYFLHKNPFGVLQVASYDDGDTSDSEERLHPNDPSSSKESDDDAMQSWMIGIENNLTALIDEDDDDEQPWITVGGNKQKKEQAVSSKLGSKKKSQKKKRKKKEVSHTLNGKDDQLIDECITFVQEELRSTLWYAQLCSKNIEVMQHFLTLFYEDKERVFDVVNQKIGPPGNFAHTVESILLLRPWHQKAQHNSDGDDLQERMRMQTWRRVQDYIEKYPIESPMNPVTQLMRLALAQRYGKEHERNAAYDGLVASLAYSKINKHKYIKYQNFDAAIQNYIYSHPLDEYLRKSGEKSFIDGITKASLFKSMKGLADLAVNNPLSAYYFLVYFFHKDLNPLFQEYLQEKNHTLERVNETATISLKKLSTLGFSGVFRYPFASHVSQIHVDQTHPYAFIQNLVLSEEVFAYMRDNIEQHMPLRTKEKRKRLNLWKKDTRQAIQNPSQVFRVFRDAGVEVTG